MKARIFDVQRSSTVDGPGLRTTVFFKGCNLRCEWCHNPESQRADLELMVHPSRCAGCGHCAAKCPAGAIAPDGRTDRSRCTACGACEFVCPHDARQRSGRDEDTDELVRLALKDKDYYAYGGGVTVSGGECMLQIEPLRELLQKLKAAGIHTAVDTAGNVPWESFEAILPYTDLFLYDVKAFDSDLHRKLTGCGNERILENYRKLVAPDPARVWVRIPIIPDYNDVPGEMEKIAEFLRACPPAKIEPLPCHRMGESKAEALGRKPARLTAPSPERMDEIRKLFSLA